MCENCAIECEDSIMTTGYGYSDDGLWSRVRMIKMSGMSCELYVEEGPGEGERNRESAECCCRQS